MTFEDWFEEAWRKGQVTGEYKHDAEMAAKDGWEAALRFARPEGGEMMLDCLRGKLTSFDAICGYVSILEIALADILRVHANDNQRPKAFYIAAKALERSDMNIGGQPEMQSQEPK